MGTRRTYRELQYGFGRQLLTLRTRASLTQADLAEQLGVHRRSVQNWETGESYPKSETLQRLIASLLRRSAFLAGRETVEAQRLWNLAEQHSPQGVEPFDAEWFAFILSSALPASTSSIDLQPSHHAPEAADSKAEPRATLIDWGEAIAVPKLVGRDEEVATLRRWIVGDECRVVVLLGLGGIGKSSLAITVARNVLSDFDYVIFHSLQNAPPQAQVLDQTIRVVSDQQASPPEAIADKVSFLVQLFRERRCLLILDNFETILQPGALTGTYRPGYEEYGAMLRQLGEREHNSCLLLTSREKPVEIGPMEGSSARVRTLPLGGLDNSACRIILEARDIIASVQEVQTLMHLYGGNPLALQLISEPIRELFGNDVTIFLATGGAFLNGIGKLLEQQFERSTAVEQSIMVLLAVEREPVAISTLLTVLGDSITKADLFKALESLQRRMQLERNADRLAFALQPVILEYVTEQLLTRAYQEIVRGAPSVLIRHALIQATAKEYVRQSQERLIGAPIIERLLQTYLSREEVKSLLLQLLERWRGQASLTQGYGPSNVIHLLRLLCGELRNLNFSHLTIRQGYFRGMEMQDTTLAATHVKESVFTEVFGMTTAVAISHDGEHWAAATRRGEVLMWASDHASAHHRLLRAWQSHPDLIPTLAFSPDGRLLATSGGWEGTVKLWDVASGTLLWVGNHPKHLYTVAFHPDGHMLASCGDDAFVRLWDVASGTQLHLLPHLAPVTTIAWHGDGRLLASGDAHGNISFWQVEDSRPATLRQSVLAHAGRVDGMAFDPSGSLLATGSWDGTVKLWKITAENEADSLPSTAASAQPSVTVQLTQTLPRQLSRVARVAWSPDGITLACCGHDPTIWLWDLRQEQYRLALGGHDDGVSAVAFAVDGRTLFSSSEDGTLRVWDVANGLSVRVMQGHATSLYSVDWSPDGRYVVSGGTDRTITIYPLGEKASDESKQTLLDARGSVVMSVGWSPDGRWVASSEWDNIVRLWDARTGVNVRHFHHAEDPNTYFSALAWSTDNRLACATYRHGVWVWEQHTDKEFFLTHHSSTWIRCVAWSPDGRYLAGGDENGAIYIWNVADRQLLWRLEGHYSAALALAWEPEGRRLASGGIGKTNGELFVWDVEQGKLTYTMYDHPALVCAVAWGLGESVIISGDSDGVLRWWDLERGVARFDYPAHDGIVQSLRASPNGSKLASCGSDGAIKLWDLHSGDYLQVLRRDRPYERMVIAGMTGITEAQRNSLLALGSLE